MDALGTGFALLFIATPANPHPHSAKTVLSSVFALLNPSKRSESTSIGMR
jgi:hypothetical protein